MGCCGKQKTRAEQKISLLIVGEGPSERFFLQHLKSMFWCKNCSHNVKIDNANGGAPELIVHRANQLIANMSYSKCAIVLDTDRPWDEENLLRKIRAQNPSVEICAIGSTPCLEGLMLEILEGRHPRKSTECKRLFKKNYIEDRYRRNLRKYAQVFPEKLISEASERVASLNRILRYLKNEV